MTDLLRIRTYLPGCSTGVLDLEEIQDNQKTLKKISKAIDMKAVHNVFHAKYGIVWSNFLEELEPLGHYILGKLDREIYFFELRSGEPYQGAILCMNNDALVESVKDFFSNKRDLFDN